MAFDNILFPDYPNKIGGGKVVTDPVAVNTNGTYEYRLKRTRWERYSWSLVTQTMTVAQKEEIKSFLLARNHALNSFTFVDIDEPDFVDAPMAYGGSAERWIIALPLDSSTPGTHPIFNPDVSQLTASINGGPYTSSVYATTITDGIPYIYITGSSPGDTIKINGPIHFTVRLNTDFKYAMVALDCNSKALGFSVNAIELTEVFGEY